MMEYNNGDIAGGAVAPGGGGGGASSSRPAPYGRACVNCARAKCKCILRNGSDSCERCFRLRKDCSPSFSVRKKRAMPRNSSQTARLERKLDGLVSLLKASSQGGNLSEQNINDVSNILNGATTASDAGSAAAATANTATTTAATTAAAAAANSASSPSSSSKFGISYNKNSTRPPLFFTVEDPNTTTTNNNNTTSSSSSTTTSHHQDHHGKTTQRPAASPLTPASNASSSYPYNLPRDVEPTTEEEQLWYRIFLDKFVDHAPFLSPIIHNMSIVQVRQERPFLWLCIMAVSCPFVQKQMGLGLAVREVLAREVLVEGERTIDYLLGALSFAQWAHYHFQLGPLLTLLSGVCTSILLDIELDKPAQHEMFVRQPGRIMHPRFSAKLHIPESRTMEHRRLALSTWMFSSSTAFFHHKSELLPWSPYLDDCLKLLDEAKETFSDELLVYQIKIQQILSHTSIIYGRLRGSENEQSTRLVLPYIQSLKRQLIALKGEIPEHVAANKFIRISILHAAVAVNEVALIRTPHAALMADRDLETMECLVECLESIRAWTELFLTFDYNDYIGAPFGHWKQLALMMWTLVRLATLEDPAWDTDRVRRTVDLPMLLDHVSANMNYVASLAPWKKNADNVHSRSGKLMATLVSWSRSVYEGGSTTAIHHCPDPTCGRASATTNANATTASPNSVPAVSGTPLSQSAAAAAATAAAMQPNPLLMMNDGTQQTSAAAAFTQEQPGLIPLAPEMFPYFNQEPWANDIFPGFWDIWSAGRPHSME